MSIAAAVVPHSPKSIAKIVRALALVLICGLHGLVFGASEGRAGTNGKGIRKYYGARDISA